MKREKAVMRNLLVSTLILASVMFGAAVGNAASVENEAVIQKGISREMIDVTVELINFFGYRCDSVSAMRMFFSGRGFVVKCNRFAYSYEVEDRGGNWVVCYDEC